MLTDAYECPSDKMSAVRRISVKAGDADGDPDPIGADLSSRRSGSGR